MPYDFEVKTSGDNWEILHAMMPDLFDNIAKEIEREIEILIQREIIQELIVQRKEQLHKENIWNSITDICKTRV